MSTDTHVNCQLVDFSTIFSANTVLRKARPKWFWRYNHDESVCRNFAWELRCLEIVIEALVLRNELFMPADVDVTSMTDDEFGIGKLLIDKGILRGVSKEDRQSENSIDELSSRCNESLNQFLWNLSNHLLENVPQYSLHPELLSFSENLAVYKDKLSKEDIVKYNLYSGSYDREHPDKAENAFEYMFKTLLYDLIAKRMGISYAPHPVRVPFIEACELAESRHTTNLAYTVFDSISEFRSQVHMYLKLQPQYIPPLFGYIIAESRNTDELLTNALRLRDSDACKQFRDKCSEIEEELTRGRGGLKLTSYITQVNDMLDNLRKELGISSELAQSSVWLLRVPIRIPRIMFTSYYLGSKSHLNWLKDIAKLSVDITSMKSHLERVFKPSRS